MCFTGASHQGRKTEPIACRGWLRLTSTFTSTLSPMLLPLHACVLLVCNLNPHGRRREAVSWDGIDAEVRYHDVGRYARGGLLLVVWRHLEGNVEHRAEPLCGGRAGPLRRNPKVCRVCAECVGCSVGCEGAWGRSPADPAPEPCIWAWSCAMDPDSESAAA